MQSDLVVTLRCPDPKMRIEDYANHAWMFLSQTGHSNVRMKTFGYIRIAKGIAINWQPVIKLSTTHPFNRNGSEIVLTCIFITHPFI